VIEDKYGADGMRLSNASNYSYLTVKPYKYKQHKSIVSKWLQRFNKGYDF